MKRFFFFFCNVTDKQERREQYLRLRDGANMKFTQKSAL